MWRGISLANKCLLLFGGAVVLIIVAALAVPWLRMNAIVDEAQKELSRQLVDVWERGVRSSRPPSPGGGTGGAGGGSGDLASPTKDEIGDAVIVRLNLADARAAAAHGLDAVSGGATPAPAGAARATGGDTFIARALNAFDGSSQGSSAAEVNEYHQARWVTETSGNASVGSREYRFARAIRDEAKGGSLAGMVVLTRISPGAGAQLLVNTAYLFSAGLIALGLALLVFYLITNKLILSPVRELRQTAERVREGNISTRSDIRTGDEFEELSETFNQMLEAITTGQEKLSAINAQLDLKVNELSERNVALYESNRMKGEFLANVSHELRTPLNSIIGFAELLHENVGREEEQIAAAAANGQAAPEELTKLTKRKRYLENILRAGRSLLGLIEGLLEMAKVEAGRLELKLVQMDLREACEALLALIRPLADRGGVELHAEVAPDVPSILTDPDKFQQIIFNLLSNAVKFTSEKAADEKAAGKTPVARVTLRAERLVGRGSEGPEAQDRVRISVLDTGPGIAAEDQKKIFQKFEQLDTGHTRRHSGTGLGLAICKELTIILQGEIQVESELGRGAMFSVILPLAVDTGRAEEMKTEMAFRGKLAGRS
ncbi:MAG TPA: HAMP domain-containing sensor histidine kinase [Phycisphaerales bacterium]|nr:HAMP domain-containing sensor histidine kinase [Phycisphaerales bacterium]